MHHSFLLFRKHPSSAVITSFNVFIFYSKIFAQFPLIASVKNISKTSKLASICTRQTCIKTVIADNTTLCFNKCFSFFIKSLHSVLSHNSPDFLHCIYQKYHNVNIPNKPLQIPFFHPQDSIAI